MDRDPASTQMHEHKEKMTDQPSVLLTGNGAPIAHKTASLTVGHQGPLLLQDHVFLDEMSHFNRERIPERVVHAKGAGAFGYFEVTHDITKYTKAKIFSKIGKRTPIAVRFSTVGGESGSADTVRDPRGFAVKFYTEEGVWDLVGNNTPIFFIKDPILFPSFIHTQKRNPVTHLKDMDMFWDFISLRPETTHQVMILFSDRGIPDGYRYMNGYGSHTFKLVNDDNQFVYCKFHYKTDQGIKNLFSEKASKISSQDPDYSIRDLYNAIAKKNFPSWTFYIQVMTEQQAEKFKWNPFDLTKALSFAEKKRYNEMAKYKRGGGNSEEKLTGIGESLKLVEKREQERRDYLSRMEIHINNVVSQAYQLGDLKETPFYIIHVNWYYTKTNVEDNSVDYIPAEFAVVEFRLNEGIKRIYQDILKMKIETGYTREAMEHSDATHKIDVNDNVPETKFEDLYTKFRDFLTSQDRPSLSASGQKLPILYTTRKIENVVRCFLNRMTEAAGVPHNTFNLYSLDYLFGTLMMYLNDNFPKESNRASLAEAEFDKDAFIFTSNIECAYHRNIEGTSEHCSQSVVTQWSYAICDYCCLILGIHMVSGKHRPYRIDEEVASGVHGMKIKKIEKVSVIKSETGVSEAYRLKVSERSRKEEELRKKQGRDILFIDHSQIQKPKPTVVISSAASSISSSSSYGSANTSRSLRPPSTMSEIVKGSASTRVVLDDFRDFPALDGSHKSRQFKKL